MDRSCQLHTVNLYTEANIWKTIAFLKKKKRKKFRCLHLNAPQKGQKKNGNTNAPLTTGNRRSIETLLVNPCSPKTKGFSQTTMQRAENSIPRKEQQFPWWKKSRSQSPGWCTGSSALFTMKLSSGRSSCIAESAPPHSERGSFDISGESELNRISKCKSFSSRLWHRVHEITMANKS